MEPLLPILRELPEITASVALQDFLFPETYTYDLRAEGEMILAIPSDRSENARPFFGASLPDASCASWPQFKPRDIQLCGNSNVYGPPTYTPFKVILPDGRLAFVKLIRPGDTRSFVNELGKYRSIRDAHLDESLQTSRLLGLVQNETGPVFGLLLSYIECDRRTLLCAARSDTPKQLK
jgi:hypothetical protein